MRLKLKPNQQRIPFGGHHYPSGHGITFKGETCNEVVEKLVEFKLNNGLPMGDPEQEVLIYYAKNWPWLVTADRDPPQVEAQTNFLDWRDWISRVWQNPPQKIINKKESEPRWEVCRECPFNTKPEWKATPESTQVSKREFILRKGLEVPAYLGVCSLHRTDLRVFTLIENAKDFSAKREGEEYAGCWVK